MKHLKIFINLTRLNRPIGFMLLFWPCSWGLVFAYSKNLELYTLINYLFLFFCGSVLMRSAGCIFNDIVDKDIDIKVERTKNRPIASRQISVIQGLFYSALLCLIALIVLVQFNFLTIILALGSMPLAFTYPLMKRYTYWPQLFLGITFNYGLLLGWTSITNEITLLPFILYVGAIFWTLGFDTIYGFQDIKDDEIIGLKSTSIKFKSNPYKFLIICYSIFLVSLLIIGFSLKLNQIYFMILVIVALQMYYFQIYKLDIKKMNSCLNIFKSNNLLGLLIFASLFIGKI